MVTSQTANTGPFVPIPQIIRDVYSKEILLQAQPRLRFMQFAKVKRDLTAIKGKAIVFTKFNNLSRGGRLNEFDNLQTKNMSAINITIPVTEHGNGITVTELSLQTALIDELEAASVLLANDLAVTQDAEARDALLTTTNIVFGGQGTTTPPTTASALVTGDGLDTTTIKDAVEILARNNAPKFQGQYYVCFATPHQIRQLRDDPSWQDSTKYTVPRPLFLGEIGMYEGVVFIDTTNMPILTQAQYNTKYGATATISGNEVHEAVIFGENAFAYAVALDPELRDNGVTDFGRKHSLAWYGIYDFGVLEELNVVRIVTA
jgi:N4-gp56 family major capsid protein